MFGKSQLYVTVAVVIAFVFIICGIRSSYDYSNQDDGIHIIKDRSINTEQPKSDRRRTLASSGSPPGFVSFRGRLGSAATIATSLIASATTSSSNFKTPPIIHYADHILDSTESQSITLQALITKGSAKIRLFASAEFMQSDQDCDVGAFIAASDKNEYEYTFESENKVRITDTSHAALGDNSGLHFYLCTDRQSITKAFRGRSRYGVIAQIVTKSSVDTAKLQARCSRLQYSYHYVTDIERFWNFDAQAVFLPGLYSIVVECISVSAAAKTAAPNRISLHMFDDASGNHNTGGTRAAAAAQKKAPAVVEVGGQCNHNELGRGADRFVFTLNEFVQPAVINPIMQEVRAKTKAVKHKASDIDKFYVCVGGGGGGTVQAIVSVDFPHSQFMRIIGKDKIDKFVGDRDRVSAADPMNSLNRQSIAKLPVMLVGAGVGVGGSATAVAIKVANKQPHNLPIAKRMKTIHFAFHNEARAVLGYQLITYNSNAVLHCVIEIVHVSPGEAIQTAVKCFHSNNEKNNVDGDNHQHLQKQVEYDQETQSEKKLLWGFKGNDLKYIELFTDDEPQNIMFGITAPLPSPSLKHL